MSEVNEPLGVPEIRDDALRGVLEQSSVATLVTDGTMRLCWCNAAAAEIFASKKLRSASQELRGTSLAELLEERRALFVEPEGFVDAVLASYADGGYLQGVECRVAGDGGERWLEYSSQQLASGDLKGGRVERYVDVTERRRARLLRENHRLQAQKMEALGALAGTVAHDINNLLTAINGYSQLLERMLEEESHRNYVQEIRKAGKRAAVMTSDLLRISRRQVVRPRIVDLRLAIQDREEILRRALGPDVELLLRLAPHLGTVEIDPAELEQILLNMAVNAGEAMPGGGTFVVAGRNVDLGHSLGDLPPGRYVRLDLTDDGTGMDADLLGRIFEPLFTTKEKAKGAGFGLATAYAAVQRAAGFIQVESKPGEGTTFRIFLPRVNGETATKAAVEQDRANTEAAAAAGDAVGGGGGRGRVLLVEDNESVRTLIAEVFEQKGYSLLTAGDAEQALEVLAAEQDPVDLLISDIVMPAMSGPELARGLIQRFPAMRFLFISGYDDDSLQAQGLDTGGHTVVQKPFDPEDLELRARALLDA